MSEAENILVLLTAIKPLLNEILVVLNLLPHILPLQTTVIFF